MESCVPLIYLCQRWWVPWERARLARSGYAGAESAIGSLRALVVNASTPMSPVERTLENIKDASVIGDSPY